ncbi:exonuclease SbcCD subunit D [Bacillus suaedae]|uniref:Nuclease SbcCD subunit D n=1 Tax=Halalkalibacter suaedae TaxID=2822140 RepID=A0A940WVX1_9BACI|nr:exonuclease SbcCD subunit D [Bacillus suaedae]MBP3953266.1 exonuclease SbcCD subunit D [Bacillus suaedae]
MKFFHTADWHLGKLVQGVYMTEDQRHVLNQFVQAVKEEKPDAVIIAGDLYDRAIPPTEAVDVLDDILETIVIKLNTPVLAIGGNHDGPQRLDFGRRMMKSNGFHIVGQFTNIFEPVVLNDEHGEVHFHLIPYVDPSKVRYEMQLDEVRTHDDAMKSIVEQLTRSMDPNSRHVFVGHAFVTPGGEPKENTSDSERPLAIGGVEHVNASVFEPFHYTALGHLHQAHHVGNEKIRYAGSPLKYSISEEHHKKGYFIVNLDKEGHTTVEKRLLDPIRHIRTVEGTIDEIEQHKRNDDYVFIKLLDENPVLSPMERVRSVYPNAMHIERRITAVTSEIEATFSRSKMDELSLFKAFYKEVKAEDMTQETEQLFKEVLQETIQEDGGRS